MIKIKSNKIILLDSIFDGYVYFENGKIVEVSKEDKKADIEYDFTGKYISPGLIEMHSHGGGGFAFINSSVDDVIEACNFHVKHGTTTILPTITAGPFINMKNATINVVEAINSGKLFGNVPGVHLEGPYLSKEQCGAQYPEFITSPKEEDYVPFVEEYHNYIKKWTYAPEIDKDCKFVKFVNKYDIIGSIGHSNATYEDVKNAVKNGASMVTHLYSCTSTITRENGYRKLGVTESAYLIDDLTCEIIADGSHLPIELLKLIFKTKSFDKLVLISDCLEITGTDIKKGVMSGTKFIVEDNVCKLEDRSAFAGSIATGEVLIKTALSSGVAIFDAIKMASYNPARLLNLNKGLLKENYDADIIVFDENIEISNVFINGKKLNNF